MYQARDYKRSAGSHDTLFVSWLTVAANAQKTARLALVREAPWSAAAYRRFPNRGSLRRTESGSKLPHSKAPAAQPAGEKRGNSRFSL